ncbi:MAG: hypothetical protein IPJ01_12735 [Micavibrio sp.]|nr:hypothetical protein [Micavibrio sp.]
MPRFNPLDPQHLARLNKAREMSFKALDPFREFRLKAMREVVGKHYGHEGSMEIVPMPMLRITIEAFVQRLVAQNPTFAASSTFPQLATQAAALQAALRQKVEQINLRETLREVVFDSMIGHGVVKVGTTITTDGAEGWSHLEGEPFCDAVALTNWVHDMGAVRPEQVDFCGDRYRVPLDEVRENALFDPQVRSQISGGDRDQHNPTGGGPADEARRIGSGSSLRDEPLHQWINLWDIWLPRDRLLITVADQHDHSRPLRIMEWDGPDAGPYHQLWYTRIPENTFPLPPAMGWYDIHILLNQLMRKAGRQAERQRTILGYSADSSGEAQRIQNADDEEAIKMNDPAAVKEFRFGGADAANVALMMQFRQIESWIAGNVDAIAGLMPSSDTVGQDRMLNEAASESLKSMAESVELFAGQVGKSLGHYLWTSESTMQLEMQVEGTDYKYQRYWGPEQRIGRYYQYLIDVVPHSMRKLTPDQRAATIEQLLSTVVAPMMPILAQQGYGIDVRKLLTILAQAKQVPELLEVVVPMDPAMAAVVEADRQPEIPAAVERTRGSKGRPQVDPFMKHAQQMSAEQRSND